MTSTSTIDLGLGIPLLAAPMSGGPTTTAMVIAASRAGGLGFLATGYKPVAVVAAEVGTVRAAGVGFGVNVFAPTPVPISQQDYAAYAETVQREADPFGITLPTRPIDSDDDFDAKVDLLVNDPVPAVSFTFGIPDRATIGRLRRAGTVVLQTVTSPAEATAAREAGVDALVVQAGAAGGHSGTFTPERPVAAVPLDELVAQVIAVAGLPVIAAGGLGTPASVARVLAAGAQAAAVGTALLLADESGASATHRAALGDPARSETVITRAFSGRPARALRNRFIDRYEATAPLGYPAIHYLTSPLRKAAAAAGEPELVHLWAGTSFAQARRGTTAEILGGLLP